ncbi:MAG: SET domain-containing protein-lysine N-methyltransferase [Niastella sp.]|uniref:SET domain-containing protein n=1 Tax=Niastella sp. TaxID=1869183 RepID=UPI00389AD0D5
MAFLEKQLYVKKSTLPNAGKGLFTKKFIPKGTRIVEYKGKTRTWKEVQADEDESPYIYYVKRNFVIDALNDKKALARYANDARGLERVKDINNNAEYAEEGVRVFIVAAKDIPAGGEILVGYGPEYWQVIRHNIRIDEKEKKKAQANGVKVNGTKINGKKLNGKATNGKKVNGKAVNGKKVNGKKTNGVKVNGKVANGKSVHAKVNGVKKAKGKGQRAKSLVAATLND